MSGPLFSTLPPELICQVFQYADDFSIVAALAQTARIFYYTWRENPASICRAVAPRVILNIADAERLLDMQEEAEPASQSQDRCEKKSITRAKRLLFNTRCASATSNNWVDFCQIQNFPYREDNPHMRPSELARFEHAFYCVWAIGVMGKAPHLQNKASAFLDACSHRELFRLDEMAEWTYNYNDNNFGPPGFDLEDEVWKVGRNLVSNRYRLYARRRPLRAAPDSHDAPCGFFAYFDHTQRYLDHIEDE